MILTCLLFRNTGAIGMVSDKADIAWEGMVMMMTQAKNKIYMTRNIILGLLIVLLVFAAEIIYVFAANEKVITSATDDTGVYLYLKGVENLSDDAVTVQIGSSVCDNVSIMGLDEFSIPMRTVILIDNSYSIRSEKRSDIQNILTSLVEQSMAGEEYRIGIFSDTITWLTDYSSDYESIKTIINLIEYRNQDTYLNDCLYSVIEEISNHTDAVYTRLIMISDGADDRGIGYTSYEVNALVEKSNIPVYMIGTPGDDKALETMFSYARASKADYYQLDNSVSNEDIVGSLAADRGLTCIYVVPDAGMMDGSQKNIQITIAAAEGEIKLTTAVNMPFVTGTVPVEEPEVPEEEAETPVEEAEIPVEEKPEITPSLPVLGDTTETGEDNTVNQEPSGINMTLLIIIIVVVLIVAAAVVVLIVMLNKKKQKANSFDASSEDSSKQNVESSPNVEEDDDKTQMISVNRISNDGNATRMLLGQPMQMTTYLVLKSLDRPDTEFRVPIQNVIRIGRKNADIVIDFDKHISSNHCEIIKRGELLYVKDLGSLNGTFYENIQVLDQEIPIVDGGIIRFGNSRFSVTLDKQN